MENFEYIIKNQYTWALMYRMERQRYKLQKNREEKRRFREKKEKEKESYVSS